MKKTTEEAWKDYNQEKQKGSRLKIPPVIFFDDPCLDAFHPIISDTFVESLVNQGYARFEKVSDGKDLEKYNLFLL